jgi:glycosyltransferase involved in cell wall biosynthesis
MPVRNGLPYLEKALASLSAQTFEDFEIIALEDGSTDGTAEVLAAWPDERLRAIPTGGIGFGASLQLGLREAKAPLVARQDADDVSLPERLARQVAFLEAHRHVDLVGCNAEYIDAADRPVDNDWVRTVRAQQDPAVTPDQIRDLMPLTCCLTHGSVVARRDVLRAAGGYRTEMAPAEDYDLWLRLLPHAELTKLPERLYQYRVHGNQWSTHAKDHQIRHTLIAKLTYLRRLAPRLPEGARLGIVGSVRGGDYYRSVAPACGFTAVTTRPTLERPYLSFLARAEVRRWALEAWDVLAVTDFPALDAYNTIFADTDERALVRVGNFFVKQEYLR